VNGRLAKKLRQNAKRYVKDRLRTGELVAKARIKPCPWWMPALLWHGLIRLVLKDANARGTATIADIRAPGPTITVEPRELEAENGR
jgi:hypothetical protein